MSNPSQLFLLCDHIKLSLLERARAASLSLEPIPATDSNISRSLESLHEVITALESKPNPPDADTVSQLHSQYNDLSRQFHGETSTTASTTLTSPNNPALSVDFALAQSEPVRTGTAPKSSNLKSPTPINPATKSVRFRDSPSPPPDPLDEANRAALFPGRYTDNPPTPPDPTAEMSNPQIHAYHERVIAEQDGQLDELSHSIGRQRHLSMQIGDELEGHVALLDEVDRGVDRQQSRIDVAKRRLAWVGKKASQNWGMTTIIVLIVILVLLIVVLK